MVIYWTWWFPTIFPMVMILVQIIQTHHGDLLDMVISNHFSHRNDFSTNHSNSSTTLQKMVGFRVPWNQPSKLDFVSSPRCNLCQGVVDKSTSLVTFEGMFPLHKHHTTNGWCLWRGHDELPTRTSCITGNPTKLPYICSVWFPPNG